MLIIWRRMGWLVPVIVLASMVVSALAVEFATGGETELAKHWRRFPGVILASAVLGILGYHLNYRNRPVHKDEETGELTQAPSHTFFYLPMQFWAVIYPIFFVWLSVTSAQETAETEAYLAAPQVNDIYITNFYNDTENLLSEEKDDKFQVSVLKITSVDADGVMTVSALYLYKAAHKAKRDIYKTLTKKEKQFHDDPIFYSWDELRSLRDKGVILSIHRKEPAETISQ